MRWPWVRRSQYDALDQALDLFIADCDYYRFKWVEATKIIRTEASLSNSRELLLMRTIRDMDQAIFSISQVAPDWDRMRPLFAELLDGTNLRMSDENNRIKEVLIQEMQKAYPGPNKPLEPKSISYIPDSSEPSGDR